MFRICLIGFLLAFVCLGTVLAQPTSDISLQIKVAEWAYDVRDEGDYDPNPEGAFPRGERAYAYLEICGFTLAEIDDLLYLDVEVDIALKTLGGLKLFSELNLLEFESWYFESPESLWFYIYVDIPWWAPSGVYWTEVTIRDQINKKELTTGREIRVY